MQSNKGGKGAASSISEQERRFSKEGKKEVIDAMD